MWWRNTVRTEGIDKHISPNKNLEVVGQERGAKEGCSKLRNSKCKDPEVTESKMCLHKIKNTHREEPEVRWGKGRGTATMNLSWDLS